MVDRPVPAVRRTVPTTASSGLLINVIRTLTSSVSEDQRELEKTRLEKGYRESGEAIHTLLKHHQKDVQDCLLSFKDVSSRISGCRERIQNVRNALHSCKMLLEMKRDDLKKLWVESSQQKHIAQIMNTLMELRNVPVEVEMLLEKKQLDTAAQVISGAKRQLRDLHRIDGLSQLRLTVEETKDRLTESIMHSIVYLVVDEPFEKQIMDLTVGMSVESIRSSDLISKILRRSSERVGTQLVAELDRNMHALEVLDKDVRVVDRIGNMCAAAIDKQIRATVLVMRTRHGLDETHSPDPALLSLLMKTVSRQIEHSRDAQMVLSERSRQSDLLVQFWRACQTALDSLVSEHVGIVPVGKESTSNEKRIFRFDKAATCTLTSQNWHVICRPDLYNLVPMFPWLRHIIEMVEDASKIKPCTLSQFVNTVLIERFIDRVKTDLDVRLNNALRQQEMVREKKLISVHEGIQRTATQVMAMCRELHNLILSMDTHAHSFASLMMLVLDDYCKNMSKLHSQATCFPSESDTVIHRKKISAAWAADEDISRLLTSLPNWEAAQEEELDEKSGGRHLTERESDILIGNLGTQKQIEESELIRNIADISRLASLHENLRWLAAEIRSLLAALPQNIRNALRQCNVQVKFEDGRAARNEVVISAIEEVVSRIESMSNSSLLMLHLEIRVHCFYHLLPLARPKSNRMSDDVDPEVHEFGREVASFHSVLVTILSKPKLRYVFEGLGHLCAAIMIHSSQHMPRLSESAKKRVCRNIWGIQQRLSHVTGRREVHLDRARAFFELLSQDMERLMAAIPEKRNAFSPMELNYLVGLAVRSHPVLSSQPGALDTLLSQLNAIIRLPQTPTAPSS